jgi:hypothetical protein
VARIRTIKPAAFLSERVDEYAGDMFRTFVGLWCYCDDKGRGRDDEDLVKAEVWPRVKRMTSAKVRGHIDTIAEPDDGPLCRYEVAGQRLFHFVNWTEHQRINRPTASKLPPCPHHEPEGLFQ